MIRPTPDQHQGFPILEPARCLSLSDRLTPAFVGGKQVGFLREQSTTLPRDRVELTEHRHGFYMPAGGVQWAGD